MDDHNQSTNLENFEELFVGHPIDIEEKLTSLLPKAKASQNPSTYLEILSKIALAQAMQQKYELAHQTLDKAEAMLKPEYKIGRVKIWTERARVFHQSGDINTALPLFVQAYEQSIRIKTLDYYTIDIAHMIAILIKTPLEKITWNNKAIKLAEKSHEKRCNQWLGSLYNNLGHNYIEAQQYDKALKSYEMCKSYGESLNQPIIIRGALWGIGKSLRLLGLLEDALKIHLDLSAQYKNIRKDNTLPIELIKIGRGLVYEELAEIYLAQDIKEQSKKYAKLAYNDLIEDPWMKKLYPKRLERMLTLSNI